MGDQLIGYISDPHTLEIHRTTCPVFKEKAADTAIELQK